MTAQRFDKLFPFALLTVAQMYDADRLAMARADTDGASGLDLMEAAGAAVTRALRARWAPCPVLVLCGPGNNGGDGFVVARLLADQGWPVRVALLGDRSRLKGDAAVMAARWQGPVDPASPAVLEGTELLVDALFGAGLDRPLSGPALDLVRGATEKRLPVVAIDVPSGLAGDSGRPLGEFCFQAELTLCFFRAKPGHLLLPGRQLCGEVVVADIGIPEAVLATIAPRFQRNEPALWQLPKRTATTHKYNAGHLLIHGGSEMTGAARLAARAASRMGAGLVTVAAAEQALPVYQSAQASLLTLRDDRPTDFVTALQDPRRNVVLLGPGAGVSPATRARAEAALRSGKSLLLDADGLGVFSGQAGKLASLRRGALVVTPHDGELARLFPDLHGDRLSRALAASQRLNAVVLLKGADSVVAHPDGRAVINDSAPPELATAGSGDVLAGMIAGLLAQGLAAFEAAAAGCWLHGQAAARHGPGLIADDLPDLLAALLPDLRR